MKARHSMQEEFDMEKELQQEFIQELAEFFKIFGDATWIRILQTPRGGSEMGGFGRRIGMSQSAASGERRMTL